MTGVRDYITGKIRFPGGPESSCGEDDVQMVENVDLLFGDNEELKFGDDGDVYIKWNASNLVILPLTDLTGAIQIGNGTLSMDLKVFGTVAGNYMEWDASEDQLNIVVASRTITGKDIALNISMVGTVGASDYIIGLKSEVTPDGGGAIYGMAVQGILNLADAAVSGYACGAEFRLVTSGGSWNLCDNAVLVLATDVENTGSPPAAVPYIMLREYGTNQPANALVRFFDHTRASASDAVILSQTTVGPFDTAVRCMVGITPFWLYGSTQGPATLTDMAFGDGDSLTFGDDDDVSLQWSGDLSTRNWVLGIGASTTLTMAIDTYCFPIRVNITNTSDPGASAGFSWLRLQFFQTTEHQANLWVRGVDACLSLSKNLANVQAVAADVRIETAMTVTSELMVAKFTLTKNAIPTAHDIAVVQAYVRGSETHVTTGGSRSSCFQAKCENGADVESAFELVNVAGCDIDYAIKIGAFGAVDYFLYIHAPNEQAGASIGCSAITGDTSAHDSDGCLKIKVGDTDYFIPFYAANHVTGEW